MPFIILTDAMDSKALRVRSEHISVLETLDRKTTRVVTTAMTELTVKETAERVVELCDMAEFRAAASGHTFLPRVRTPD